MRTISYASLATLLLAGQLTGQPLPPPEAWDAADRETIRLPASEFPTLPILVREELERRNCSIPQTGRRGGPGNVITGHFTSADQMDVAVLCSRDRMSSILVFRNGSTAAIDEFDPRPDADYLQGVGNGEIGFSHQIFVATPEDIRGYYQYYEGVEDVTPPAMLHDGIEDAFIGKTSSIRYWDEDHWRILAGAD